MANNNTAFVDFSGITCCLKFPFDMQLDDHNWYISSQLLSQQKGLNGKKRTISGQIFFDSLLFSPLISRVYFSQIRNSIYYIAEKLENIFKCRKKQKYS